MAKKPPKGRRISDWRRNTRDEEVMSRHGVRGWNVEGKMGVDFAKQIEMAFRISVSRRRKNSEYLIGVEEGTRKRTVSLACGPV